MIDTTPLLREEKVFFDAVTALLDSYREAILYTVMNEKLPFMGPLEEKKPLAEFRSALEVKKNTKLVRFAYRVPKFVGPELEVYGPFEEEDIANLPLEVAALLISKNRVEEIKEE